jgi:hypothetical protein
MAAISPTLALLVFSSLSYFRQRSMIISSYSVQGEFVNGIDSITQPMIALPPTRPPKKCQV